MKECNVQLQAHQLYHYTPNEDHSYYIDAYVDDVLCLTLYITSEAKEWFDVNGDEYPALYEMSEEELFQYSTVVSDHDVDFYYNLQQLVLEERTHLVRSLTSRHYRITY